MRVEVLSNTDLRICATAIRTCYQSFHLSDDGGEKDKALINKVGNINKHASTLEHLTYSFYISGISRALLQELARHRIASLSVKSTRYTLKELETEAPFKYGDPRCEEYLVYTGDEDVDGFSVLALENLRILKAMGKPNDMAKFALPDAYKTELTWTINARALQNFLWLRTSKAAMWEIRNLANAVFEALPEDHKYIFEGSVQ